MGACCTKATREIYVEAALNSQVQEKPTVSTKNISTSILNNESEVIYSSLAKAIITSNPDVNVFFVVF